MAPVALHKGMPQQFDAVVITNYLWRPLMPTLLGQAWHPVVVLLCMRLLLRVNETIGRPARPGFLLQPR
jgi:hypothetical protein